MQDVVARISLDINVLYADLKGRALRVRPSASSELVEFVSSGACPAGGVQLIVSVPLIEQWHNVLVRHFGFSSSAAEELANLLYDYASDGPIGLSPLLVVGSGFVPFATEEEVLQAAERHAERNAGAGSAQTPKLFDELQDDRHVLLTALAGQADVLATANIKDFNLPNALTFGRSDMLVIPSAAHHLVVGVPAFLVHWLRRGVVPNWEFVSSHPDEFVADEPEQGFGRQV